MTSRTTILAVVIGLALFSLASLACVTFLIHDGTPDASVAILAVPMGTALGSLATLLSSTRGTLGAKDVEPSTVTLSSPTPVAIAAPQPAVPQDH